ncbi:MAG: glutamine--fructose-6-phosphate aminotransferase [isomerizing] [Porticoccaceae bacterium]|nr:MAG: glutamine--fructose-6-phosphate aminotransferase [isomerizing] [Porticoccaceae bacterium]
MCGIVGAVAQRNVTGILLEGLRRLEYRGYDSAGLAVVEGPGRLKVVKTAGKVAALAERLAADFPRGRLGIAHTRWATHGPPSEINAHPQVSGTVAVVHNGIVENYLALRAELEAEGFAFRSETDTEAIAHLIARFRAGGCDLDEAVARAARRLEGAFALAVLDARSPELLVGVRRGSPLVVGIGIEEHFLASDLLALRQVTDRFLHLEEDDLVVLDRERAAVYAGGHRPVARPVQRAETPPGEADKGGFRHYMLKEIHEQPEALAATLEGRLEEGRLVPGGLGGDLEALLPRVRQVHLIACGTSYHAGLLARYWIEAWAGVPCAVEVASEYRYRRVVIPEDTLLVAISQSGETADTLAALRAVRGYLASLAVCNVATSSLVRCADFALLTRAGPEIGVASTKAFTTQLAVLQLLALALALARGRAVEAQALAQLPVLARRVLALDGKIERACEILADKRHALFLGRGEHFPIALEGALKLKEISYIHAEAYPAGELKHGPLALVDEQMPVVAVAPSDGLLAKLRSNLQEVRARGGRLFLFADDASAFSGEEATLVALPPLPRAISPILYAIPLQLLAYHVAVAKGTDVDQPRNLAKSVTVE